MKKWLSLLLAAVMLLSFAACTAEEVDTALEILRANGEDAYVIGEIIEGEGGVVLC